MKIYELINNVSSLLLAVVEDNTHPINSSSFSGESLSDIWIAIEVETLYKRKYNDFPKYGIGKPVVSEKVKNIIFPFISGEAEFLPLLHEGKKLYMLNVIHVLDCVDWENSKVTRLPHGYIASLDKLVFDLDKLPEGTHLFKFKEKASTKVYATEAFKKLVDQNNLKGMDFSLVFDSEFTEEMQLSQQQAFEAKLAEIEQNKGEECSYEEARDRAEEGLAFVSGKWKIQLDSKGRLNLGELMLDLTYQWIVPAYIPPILLDLRWHVVEPSAI
jgi:hypothetical protein